MRILGIDPGLQKMGWGVIEAVDNRLHYIACGVVKTTTSLSLAERLFELDYGLCDIMKNYAPHEAAIEETFMNNNAASALKLGCARGAAMLSIARTNRKVSEYPANLVKKSVVGNGHATKHQIGMMVRMLLPGCGEMGADAADALAIAICHAHHAQSRTLMGGIMAGGVR